jgi:hypothetical protein
MRIVGGRRSIGKSQLQCHVVHHKSHMTCPGIELGRASLKAATNSLSYGMALILSSYLHYHSQIVSAI